MALLRRRAVGALLRTAYPSLPRIDPHTACRKCLLTSGVQWRFTHNSADTLEKFLTPLNTFPRRHVGPSEDDAARMLESLDPPAQSLDDFVSQAIPEDIRIKKPLQLSTSKYKVDPKSGGWAENLAAGHMSGILAMNRVFKSYIGAGYYGTIVPEVIKRNVLESPAWYTSYTPYQAEVSQGRLESLLNFQTMVSDLTALPIANASVLDEATAAAEAMTLAMNALPLARQKRPRKVFVVSHLCHPQTIAVLESRSTGFGIKIEVGDLFTDDHKLIKDQGEDLIGVLAQYPDTEGGVLPLQSLADSAHELGATLSVATDLLALTVFKPPGEFGADIAFGSAQRFGVPLGYGGPHAAFFACSEKFKRKIPGRLVGVSKDRRGNPALRLALQTREQHIRREKATSNICTAQALLANMSAFYAVYHGPQGLRAIAEKVRQNTRLLQKHMENHGWKVLNNGMRDDGAVLFDTIVVEGTEKQVKSALRTAHHTEVKPGSRPSSPRLNIRVFTPTKLGVSLDETVVSLYDSAEICKVFGPLSKDNSKFVNFQKWVASNLHAEKGISVGNDSIPEIIERSSAYLTHPVFNTHHSETELLRYIHHLQSKDLSLVHSMIPLGSCTMKLNGTTEMLALSSNRASDIHPFAPHDQTTGYKEVVKLLSEQLVDITGMNTVSLQPNSGAQGEFTGLRVIKKYLDARNDGKKRTICLIPVSAHGTNPASAAMAGMKVVPLKCDPKTGNLDLEDLNKKCEQYKDELAAIMITYPSTFGVFEPEIKKVCSIVHDHGGQVYMDGANLNAQIGLCNPGDIGADVCHLNLHKTFCIPHGGGGPGVGPIAVKQHLAKHLPSHPFVDPHATPKQEPQKPVSHESKTKQPTTQEPESEEEVIERLRDQGYLLPSYNDYTSPLNEAGRAKEKERDPNRALAISPVSATPWGSASILPISYIYNKLMGGPGLTEATKITLLNANYIMSRLKPHYSILYTNAQGRCAHEFILDARKFKDSAGIEAIDIAKRLQDYGFHAPTMSWPVAGTLMIEPTESESKAELDRFCDALISIRKEIEAVEKGEKPREGNLLKMAPHTQADLLTSDWDRCYTREEAAYPLPWLREKKFWPSVCRVDDGKTSDLSVCEMVY
jgi:glycine dehydrogenase